MISAWSQRISLSLFAILQLCGIGCIVFAFISAARDPWSSCAGTSSLGAGLLLLLLSILPGGFALKGRKAFLLAFAVILELAGSLVALRVLFATVVGPQRERIELSDPAATVRDARRLIEGTNSQHKTLETPDLPPSLRIPNLKYAYFHGDHVDLVTYRHPDVFSGFRIWSSSATQKHADRPTRYPGIFAFDYNGDAANSPDNLP